MTAKLNCILIHLLEKNYSGMFYIAGYKLQERFSKLKKILSFSLSKKCNRELRVKNRHMMLLELGYLVSLSLLRHFYLACVKGERFQRTLGRFQWRGMKKISPTTRILLL